MGMFEEALSAIADRMTEASDEGSPDPEHRETTSPGKRSSREIAPEVLGQIGQVLSEIREEIAVQLPKDAGILAQYISDPAFDRGIEIVENHDFGRPKLTEKLSDEVLASYVFLLQSGDKELGRMFKELADWQGGLPKPPWAY